MMLIFPPIHLPVSGLNLPGTKIMKVPATFSLNQIIDLPTLDSNDIVHRKSAF